MEEKKKGFTGMEGMKGVRKKYCLELYFF